jgi:hypothetical protein
MRRRDSQRNDIRAAERGEEEVDLTTSLPHEEDLREEDLEELVLVDLRRPHRGDEQNEPEKWGADHLQYQGQ